MNLRLLAPEAVKQHQRFGRLIALEIVGKDNRRNNLIRCRCDCGNEAIAPFGQLRNGTIVSCKCFKLEVRQRLIVNGTTRNGATKLPEFGIWYRMIERCYNQSKRKYRNYGGRGIAVCDQWRTFENFYADMGPRPTKTHSIERKDNNGPYTPDNCVWATRKEQQRNKRNNHVIILNGVAKTLAEWCEENGQKYDLVWSRIVVGKWPAERALLTHNLHSHYKERQHK